MKFSYLKFPLPERSEFFGHSILRPVIPMRIKVGMNEIQYQALVDSGADFCIFDAEVGEMLGLDVRAGSELRFSGVQGYFSSRAYLHPVTLVIGGHPYQATVGFSYDIGRQGSGIFGQKGFFDQFAVKFEFPKESIELNEKK